MRALHVLTNLELAGAQKSAVDICAGLIRAGVAVDLAFSSRGGRTTGADAPLRRAARAAGIVLHDVPAMRRAVAPGADARALAALVGLVRALRPDVVHTHMSKAGVLGRIAARVAGVRAVVHSVRSWAFYAAPTRSLGAVAAAVERAVARRTDALVAVSRALRDDGLRRGIGAAATYRVIRSGIDLDRFAARPGARAAARCALGLAPATPVIGAVGVLAPAKGPLDLVAVARRVVARRRDAVFVVVGYGPDAAATATAARAAGLGDRFRLAGRRDDVAALYPAFDVLVSASRWEGLPRVAVEAIAAGVPVVATDVGGTREIVVPGATGWLAPARDVAALAARVLEVVADPTLRGRLAAAAPALLAEHDLARVIDAHLALYAELVPEAACATT